MSDDMLPVPTALEDLEIGDEIDLPSFILHRWTVRAIATETVQGESGAARTVWHLTCRAIDGSELYHTGERLDVVARWVPLADIVEAFMWQVRDPEDRNDASIVVPALVNRLREETKRADSAETRLDESRRMRRVERDRAEEINGNRGGQ